jgi:putative oxidoreductase
MSRIADCATNLAETPVGRGSKQIMKVTTIVSRILLGLVFTFAGASGFYFITNPPPAVVGLAGAFQDVFFKSGWVLFVDSIELIAGVLLLTNRFVPVALIMLAAVIANILVFHITMAPAGLPVALVVLALWAITALPYRALFAPLFAARADAGRDPRAARERVNLQLYHARS